MGKYVNYFTHCKQMMNPSYFIKISNGELIWQQDCCETRTEKHLRAKNRTRGSLFRTFSRARVRLAKVKARDRQISFQREEDPDE